MEQNKILKWLSLSTRDKIYYGMAAIIVTLASVVGTIFGILYFYVKSKSQDDAKTISILRETVKQKSKEIEDCHKEAYEREQHTADYERDRNRKVDSMYYALSQAHQALKKVKDGK